MKYKLKFYLSLEAQFLTEFESDSPFMAIHEGEHISSVGIPLPDGYEKLGLKIERIEHLITEHESGPSHQLVIYVR